MFKLAIFAFLVVATGFALPCRAQEYLSYDTLVKLKSLSPVLSNSRLLSLSPKGHDLWKRGKLKVKASSATTVRGEFSKPGTQDVAYLLENNKNERFLVVVQESGDLLELLMLEPLKQEKIGCLLWDTKNNSLCIDTGKRRRKTKAATLISTPGKGSSMTPGYVIEEWFVNAWIWDKEQKTFKQKKPYWYNPDQKITLD